MTSTVMVTAAIDMTVKGEGMMSNILLTDAV